MRSIALITTQAFSLVNFRGALISAMAARNIVVYAMAPDYDEKTRTRVAELGAHPVDISLSRTGMNPFRALVEMLSIYIALRRARPDVVLSYFIKPVVFGSLAAWLARIPDRISLIEGLGYSLDDGAISRSIPKSLLRALVEGLLKTALAVNRLIIVLNKDDLNYLVGKHLARSDRFTRIDGIGIDLRWFAQHEPVQRPVTFLLVSRMIREKGVEDFVSAAALLGTRQGTVRFLLVGGVDANPGSVTVDKLRLWHKEGVVEWIGQVDDVRPWLAQSSVFVLPSYYREGLPRSTQEAMASGLPVITTDWVGCRETVTDGVNGFLVPPRQPAALARAMATFVTQPELISSMGRASRKIAEERFDVHAINERILRAIWPDSCSAGS